MRRWLLLSIVALLVSSAWLRAQETRKRPRERGRFGTLFALPGVELNAEQKTRLKQLREKYEPRLRESSRRQNGVYTREQREARRKALAAARKAGKRGRQLQQVAADAVKLSAEQRRKLEEIRKERTRLLETIRGEVRGLLTAAQKRKLQRRRKRNPGARVARVRPTHANVKYGPHERNVMDVWLAKSEKPTPVLISIHGGGFRGGNKSVSGAILRECLKTGISVVAITYRLSQHAIAPAPFTDSARAVQFVRSKAKQWNLDPKRFAATGGSAGAGISLWLGFHKDLADAESKDPVARQSTRLSCMAVFNGQTSYDPRFIRKLFPGTDTYKHPALAQLYGVDLNKLDALPKKKYELFEEVSPLTHLTKDDPPALLLYRSRPDTKITSQGIGIHHPKFGQVLKERMDKLGIECRVETGVGRDNTKLTMDFLKKHLGVK